MERHEVLGHPFRRGVALFIVRLIVRLLLRLEIAGLCQVPTTGPIVVVINHIAFLDPVLVCTSFSRLVTPIAKQEVFDPLLLRLLLNTYGTISVRRGEADVGAIKTALRVLRNGGIILLAPEGTRSPTHQLQIGKEGAVILALRAGAPVVPIGISGTQHVKKHWRRLRRAPIRLSVGKAFYLRRRTSDRRVSRAEMAIMTQEIMYRLAAQLPEDYRGVYQDLEAATEQHLVPIDSQRTA